ncbi:MAG: phosphoethanolamine--lipid A transferase [Gammaproteobacteria bacterium]
MKEITTSKLILLVALFLIAFDNFAFFSHMTEVYPANLRNLAFLGSIILFFGGLVILPLTLICYRKTTKPVLITILIISSFVGYFMDSYNVVIDTSMIQNAVNTDLHESLDLLSFKMVWYVLLLGVLPSIFIYRVKITHVPAKQELLSKLKLTALSFGLIFLVPLAFSNYYASFFREHKSIRYYANPSYYMYASAKYVGSLIPSAPASVNQLGMDAKIPKGDDDRELVIMVVGETARADRFSLNGYKRDTNPYLEKQNVFSFTNFWSCGTSTAESLPCMFSVYNKSDYSRSKAQYTENLLDVLHHAGVNILWIDNNSDSKGVAQRVPHISYKTPQMNSVCDIECRDEGMLAHLQSYIDQHPTGDIFIVLHQMGSHGPAYYKRYPAAFEKFTPCCHTNELQKCSLLEVSNAYDNTILYTDYFLSKVINLLKRNDSGFESALFYVSDHGESLGENGLYLHGLPSFIAPDTQRHVPAIFWFGKHYDDIDTGLLKAKLGQKFTHDNIFHTILGLMEIKTSLYDKTMDIVHDVKLVEAKKE